MLTTENGGRMENDGGTVAEGFPAGVCKTVWGGVHKALHRVAEAFDNIKLRSKMIILCVTCVLIPVVATNCVVWSLMYSAEQNRIEYQINDVCANTEKQLDGLRQSLSTMAATFYTNSELYKFLDNQYADGREYFEAYRTYIEPLSVVYGNNTYISNFVMYADNETLINGGGVGRLSSVKDTEWYRYYKESGEVSVVYSYYDSLRNMRTISLIRKMDFIKTGVSRSEKVLKLDMSYGYYNRIMSQQQSLSEVYICDENRIVFSTADPSNGAQPFESASLIDPSEAVREMDVNMFGTMWKVFVFHSDESSDLSFRSITLNHWPLLVLLILINLLLPVAVIYMLSRSITRRLSLLAKHLNMVKEERFEEITLPLSNDELGDLARDYNLMTFKMRELIEDVYKERLQRQENELQKQRAELRALHSQINPHFMFNALESIRMRSLIKKEIETAEIIEMLAVMMRKSTDWGDDMVTIASEVEFAKTYLRLQKYRFGDRLSYRFNVADDCAGYLVPKLSIVTFVENACVHGVEGVRRNCIIILSVEQDDDALRIYIEDTGAGMREDQCKAILREMREATFENLNTSKSVGIINACLRLKSCFGDNVEFELDSEEGAGLCITISIPTDCIINKERD